VNFEGKLAEKMGFDGLLRENRRKGVRRTFRYYVKMESGSGISNEKPHLSEKTINQREKQN
jgi:hypothetical protein